MVLAIKLSRVRARPDKENYLKVTINKTSGNLTLSSVISVANSWAYTQIGGGGTLITTDSNMVMTCDTNNCDFNGTQTLNNLTFAPTGNARTFTIASGTVVTTTGTLTLSGTQNITLNTGDINAQGDVNAANTVTGNGGSATITVNGTDNQTLTGSGTIAQGRLPNVVIDKASGTLTLASVISVIGDWTYTRGTVDATTNDSTLVFFDASALDGQGTSTTIAFDNLRLYNDGGTATTITLGGALDLDGNLTIDTTSTLTTSSSNYDVNVSGDWNNSGVYTSGTNITTFDGSSRSVITTGGTETTKDFNKFIVNKSGSGIAVLDSNGLDVDGDLNITAGTLDLNGYNISTTTTCNNSGTLKLTGDETVSCTPSNNSGSTVEYSATSGTRAIKDWTYHHLKINGTGGTFTTSANEVLGGNLQVSAGTLDISSGVDTFEIDGNLTLNGGTLTATSGTIDADANIALISGTLTAPDGERFTVAGDWNKTSNATFTHSSGTVTFDGTNQTITGATTWSGFKKTESTNNSTDVTMTFDHSSTQTIAALLTLDGLDDNDRINLVSSTPGTRWELTANGTFAIDYVDVTDSDASGGTTIVHANTINGGNNLNWGFEPDINVTRVEGTVDTGAMPVYSYVQDGNLTIDFNVMDADSNGLLVDLNYSSSKTEGTGTVIVNDLNISKLNTTGAFNCQDTNFQNSTQCSVDWNVSGVLDGNYYLNVSVSDGSSTDFNSSDKNVLVDNTGPSLSLISPSEGATITVSTVTLEYSATDNNTGIATYWVSSDGLTWINNSTVTSYGFTNQANGAHTYYVIATDGVDNNSSTASVNVTVSVSTPGNQGGGGGGVIYCKSYYRGANICEPTDTCMGEWARAAIDTKYCCVGICKPQHEPGEEDESFERVLSEQKFFKSFVDTQVPVKVETLDDSGKVKRVALEGEATVTRSLAVDATLKNREITGYKNTFTLAVENISGRPLGGVEIIEVIPKEIQENASNIQSNGEFVVTEEDPVLRFQIGDLENGESRSIDYWFSSNQNHVTSKLFGEMPNPITLFEMTLEDECLGVMCNDFNPCTNDYCTSGKCTYTPLSNGASCGDGKTCENNKCIETITVERPTGLVTPPVQEPAQKTGYNPLIAVVIGIIVIAGTIIFFVTRRKQA